MAWTETPEILYVEAPSISIALRRLATQFRNDPDLVLIGLWQVEPMNGNPCFQVVVTHLREIADGR